MEVHRNKQTIVDTNNVQKGQMQKLFVLHGGGFGICQIYNEYCTCRGKNSCH